MQGEEFSETAPKSRPSRALSRRAALVSPLLAKTNETRAIWENQRTEPVTESLGRARMRTDTSLFILAAPFAPTADAPCSCR